MVLKYVSGGQTISLSAMDDCEDVLRGNLPERSAVPDRITLSTGVSPPSFVFGAWVEPYYLTLLFIAQFLRSKILIISQTGNIKSFHFGLLNFSDPLAHLSTFYGSYFAALSFSMQRYTPNLKEMSGASGWCYTSSYAAQVTFDDQSMLVLKRKSSVDLSNTPFCSRQISKVYFTIDGTLLTMFPGLCRMQTLPITPVGHQNCSAGILI
jgi:hypothetical protein